MNAAEAAHAGSSAGKGFVKLSTKQKIAHSGNIFEEMISSVAPVTALKKIAFNFAFPNK